MRERTTRYVLLGILAEAGPSTGYEIRQWIELAIGQFWMESYGQIYPELRALLGEGLVEPAADSGAARERKRYAITSAGRKALAAWLAHEPRPDLRRSELLLKLFFGRFGDEAKIRAWLEQAGRDARSRLAGLEATARQILAEEEDSPSLPFLLIAIDAGRRANRARLEWTKEALRILDLFEAGGAKALAVTIQEEGMP